MMRHRSVKSFALAFASWSLVAASSVHAATSTPISTSASVSPLVAVSAYGTAESRAAICAAGCSTAMTASALAASQYSESDGTGVHGNIWPFLIGLGALVAAFFLLDDVFLSGDGIHIDVDEPTSPA
jgi:hypothetical protein